MYSEGCVANPKIPYLGFFRLDEGRAIKIDGSAGQTNFTVKLQTDSNDAKAEIALKVEINFERSIVTTSSFWRNQWRRETLYPLLICPGEMFTIIIVYSSGLTYNISINGCLIDEVAMNVPADEVNWLNVIGEDVAVARIKFYDPNEADAVDYISKPVTLLY